MVLNTKIKTLISTNELYEKIEKMAKTINETYPKDEVLNVVCVLKGAVMFFSKLVKHLEMPINMEFVTLSSYKGQRCSSGIVECKDLNLPDFENQNVLVVEDIIDKGYTLKFLIDHIKLTSKAKDVKSVVLLDKRCARATDYNPDFYCFEIENKFVVGFGMDDNEMYRNLDYIGYV